MIVMKITAKSKSEISLTKRLIEQATHIKNDQIRKLAIKAYTAIYDEDPEMQKFLRQCSDIVVPDENN